MSRWRVASFPPPPPLGRLFPRLLPQGGDNRRLRAAGGLLAAAVRWLAARTPSSAGLVRLWDAIPVPCSASRQTARRSNLAGWAEYGRGPPHPAPTGALS